MFMNIKFPLIIEVKYVHVYVHVPIFKKKTWAILERLKKNNYEENNYEEKSDQ